MTILTSLVASRDEAEAARVDLVERNRGLNSRPSITDLVEIPGGYTCTVTWGDHGGTETVVIGSLVRHWHVVDETGAVAALGASSTHAHDLIHRHLPGRGNPEACWSIDPCVLVACGTCHAVSDHLPGCTGDPAHVTLRYTVTAVYSGNLVYIGAHRYPRSELLTLNMDPVSHDAAEAQRLAAAARQDETLTHVLVDQDPDTTGLTPDTVVTGTAWRGTVRDAIHATQPEVCGTVVQIMERYGRLPATDDEVDLLDVVDHMSLDDVRLLLDDPGAVIAGAVL